MSFPKTAPFLTKEHLANSYHSDFTGKITLPALFSYFQEMAWEHATLNQFGYEHLLTKGLFWALARVRVEINRLPNWGEPFSLTTWACGTEGLFALRDYQINSSKGEKLVGATSSWLVVDAQTRRPQRLDLFKETIPIDDSIRATSMNAQKVANPTSSDQYEYSLVAHPLDIDVNGHINNIKYIEWALNTFPLEIYKKMEIKEMEINFMAEGFCGESLTVKNHSDQQGIHTITLTREADGKLLAVVHINMV